jgi:6-phosphogluconolactonase
LINSQPSGGGGPCHVAVDQAGKALLAANYGTGSMSVFPIKDGGELGAMSGFFQGEGSSVNPDRQSGPHAHCVITDPNGRFALLCDLGLDKVFVFKFDPATASITPNDPPFASVKPGSGPRHITFHPNGRFAYLINEMGSTLTAFSYDSSRGVLHEIQTESTLPGGYAAPTTGAEVAVHPSGKFVYASNRGHDSIVEFAANGDTGHLTLVGWCPTQGKTPRDFEIDPTGTWLLAANQDSNTVIVFRINPETGVLTSVGEKIEVDTPMCVKFCPL